MPTLQELNAAAVPEALRLLDGIYEHSPWIAERALARRPFATLAALKHALASVIADSGRDAQVALVRVHPELAGRAMVDRTLTAESTGEQTASGLTHCTPAEFERLQALNTAYNTRFGFPFILAVRGPRGTGLTRRAIIETFERRLDNHPDFELAECLRNINRIAELRLDDRFGAEPVDGNQVWDWAEALARFSDPGFAEAGQLTVTYLTEAHRACARLLLEWLRGAGCDETGIDAVGNVWGRYRAAAGTAAVRTLYTGSHYDTVRNGGRYDGRLGILVPIAVVAGLARAGRRLPFDLEVIGFAEEEGQRYKTAFLGSSAVIGRFDPRWLEERDVDGVPMRDAFAAAGLDPAAIAGARRDPAGAHGFIEVHIEQGPVLNELGLPLGVVTSINGSSRFDCEVIGMASHAGTTPMNRRRDAAAAVAELAVFLERRAAADGDSVGTIGMLQVPSGSVNVVPGRCRFSLDIRAPRDPQRERLVADVLAELQAICSRRGVRYTAERTMSAPAAPSEASWQRRWEHAVAALGLPVHRMPSGAGHDAMKMHEVMPQAMLFMRGGNSGISHNPLEEITADDAQLCVDAFRGWLDDFAASLAPGADRAGG
ncbi:MAG: 2-oxo-4-hydroxy-4-carboxy-5-ureidoimidazoline decarboxylase [Lautropia sp.]